MNDFDQYDIDTIDEGYTLEDLLAIAEQSYTAQMSNYLAFELDP
jgi:hypothetical protein